jgi:hypothetical protein
MRTSTRERGHGRWCIREEEHVKTKGFVVAMLVPVLSILIGVAATPPFAPTPASATPGFARQTGISCQACHTVFPELTPFGRTFKLNAYVFTNVKEVLATDEQSQRTLSLSDLPPISVMLQGSNTTLGRGVPDSGVAGDLSQRNDTQFPQALSIFYTGKIADYLGAFLQLTWEPDSDSVGIDNSDLRFASHASFASIGIPDFIYGITVNNNPTSQDVWNSTPAWGYPFVSSNVGVPPVASTLLDGQFAQESAGFGGYLYLFNHLYVELSGYVSAQTSFTNTTTGGPGPLDSTSPLPRISGVAPYWRLAWEQDWGSHALSFGTYGISAQVHPSGIGESGPRNTFTDIALDGQYQYITDRHIFSATTTWIHENQKYNNRGLSDHKKDWLDTVRLNGSYFFKRKIGGTAQLFSTSGSRDFTLYCSPSTYATAPSPACPGADTGTPSQLLGSANGNPTTQGATVEIDYLPWLNTKIGLQYTAFSKFNGRQHNYDGFGRNASENNLLYVYIWTAF